MRRFSAHSLSRGSRPHRRPLALRNRSASYAKQSATTTIVTNIHELLLLLALELAAFGCFDAIMRIEGDVLSISFWAASQ
jgi:hypothetical protein